MTQQFTREEALAEAYKRGILPDDMKKAYEQALDRGLVKAPINLGSYTVITQGSDYEYDTRPQEMTIPNLGSEAASQGIDTRSGAPVGRLSSGFAENEAKEAENYSKRLSEYYGEEIKVSKGQYGLEFANPENGRRTLIDESRLTLRDFQDAAAESITVTGAIGGGFLGMAFGVPNLGAAGGAAVGDIIKRWIGHGLDVRDAPVDEELMGATGVGAFEGAAGKTFEYGARGYQGIRRFFKPQVVSKETAERLSIAAIQDQAIADEISARTGKPLQPFTGQLTNDPTLLGHQSSLKNDPETAIRFRAQEAQNETTLEVFYDQLNPVTSTPNTAVGRAVQLEARDQTAPRVATQRDITEQAAQDLEALAKQLPSGDNSTIVNEATAAAAAARQVVKGGEDAAWTAYKSAIGLNNETALSNIKIPVDGELEAIMGRFAAGAKEAIDPADASGLFQLQPNAFKPKKTQSLNPVTGRLSTITEPAEVDLWQLQRYLSSLKRRQRISGRGKVATDPHGKDIDDLITAAQTQRDDFLKANHPEVAQLVIDAEARTLERATLFDQGLVSQLLRREQGEWMITDSQLIAGVIASGDRGAMEHLVSALGRHPAGVPTLQRSFLRVYRNEVVEGGVPNAVLHRRFMESHSEAIEVLFPGDESLKRLGSFERLVDRRIKRFELFEKNIQKSFRGKIQDISPENVVIKVFTERFSVSDVSKLMRLADAAGVGDLYSSAIRGQIRSRFYSPTTGISFNSLDKFITANEEKLVASLGQRYVRDMRVLLSGLKTIRTSASGIATTRRPGLLATISEGLARSTVARPLSPHGVALTRSIDFHQRALNRAWADIVENPMVLRAIVANKNTDIATQTGARILGLIAGGTLVESTPSVNTMLESVEEKNQ